jgi:hypothetical protein
MSTAFNIAEGLMSIFQQSIKRKAILRGHSDRGDMVNSIVYELSEAGDTVTATMYGNNYSVYVNYGVAAGRVKYPIKVMIDYLKRKGLPEKEATSAAWATRAIHKKEGMPTKASARFSKDGKRTHFVNDGFDEAMDEAIRYFEETTNNTIEVTISGIFKSEIETNIILNF